MGAPPTPTLAVITFPTRSGDHSLPLLLVGLLVRRPRLVKTVTHGMLHGGEHAKEQSQVATLQPVTRFHSCPQSVAMMRIHVHELRTPVSEHPT